jgi:hypothetical protein
MMQSKDLTATTQGGITVQFKVLKAEWAIVMKPYASPVRQHGRVDLMRQRQVHPRLGAVMTVAQVVLIQVVSGNALVGVMVIVCRVRTYAGVKMMLEEEINKLETLLIIAKKRRGTITEKQIKYYISKFKLKVLN